jgi:hypothetical protein
MKKSLLLVGFIIFIHSLAAQITTPVIKANFGVDGDIRANFFNNSLLPPSDDWFKYETINAGQYMIDTTGAAAIVANYFSNPSSRMQSFSRLMKPDFYSVLQNKLLIDAVFHRDFHGDDSTVFASGSNKNGMTPAVWTCPVAQGIPDKNDILDGFTHIRRDGPNVTDSLWMFGGLSIENTNGNRYFDFELYQTNIFYNRSTRTFGGYGPDAGHTAWQFDAGGNVLKAGDIIFSAEFSSSSLTLIQARIWVDKNTLSSITPVNFNWGGEFDGNGSAAIYGYASILPKTTGDFYTGLQSPVNTWAGPFELVRANNDVVTDYEAGQFMEFSVNLTKLGIDPGSYSNNPCGTPFRRVLIKTRSSTSFTSELKDFIAPFNMFDFPKVDAFTNLLYFCRVFPLTPVSVLNPNPNSVYTWTTANGNIVGSNIGITIMVDKPGTYVVTQQLNAACPYYSKDSVTIIFDSICRILDVDIINFGVEKKNATVILKWQAHNNQQAAQYEVEYSLNGNTYSRLTVLPATVITTADYTVTLSLDKITAPVIYFRIKITGKDGRIKYSNCIVLRSHDKKDQASIFPNPTRGDLWLSINTPIAEKAELALFNAQGKLLQTTTILTSAGENLIHLPVLNNRNTGIYMIKVRLQNRLLTQKVLKLD